jgi:hypothetical protein
MMCGLTPSIHLTEDVEELVSHRPVWLKPDVSEL